MPLMWGIAVPPRRDRTSSLLDLYGRLVQAANLVGILGCCATPVAPAGQGACIVILFRRQGRRACRD